MRYSGLTLVEILVTITILVVLSAAMFIGLSNRVTPSDLVSASNDIIVKGLTQARSKSIFSDSTATVCNINNRVCTNQNEWTNINGTKFNNRVTVTITGAVNGVITYDRGKLSRAATFSINSDAVCNKIEIYKNGIYEFKNC